ncbi:hypothetical protein JB92DRAFT_772451 [Gautieria morchelliformis]|nr:hypothetical protein JB92DRAFT_772451 [Gautieria morchelliformis]
MPQEIVTVSLCQCGNQGMRVFAHNHPTLSAPPSGSVFVLSMASTRRVSSVINTILSGPHVTLYNPQKIFFFSKEGGGAGNG